MISRLVTALLSLSLIACAHSHSGGAKKEVAANGKDFYSYHGKVYFTGSPTPEDYATFKKMGVTTVIDLREEAEIKPLKFNPAEEAKALQLTYYNYPVSPSEKLNHDVIQTIETTFMKHHKNEKILVYCSSGNRAAAWFGTHVFHKHKDQPEKAMSKARSVGLQKPQMEKKLADYFDGHKDQ